MIRLSAEYRQIWGLLFSDETPLTAAQISNRLNIKTDRTTQILCNLCRRRLVNQKPPADGTRAIRYTVDGTCFAPQGATLAELQAPDMESKTWSA